MLKILTVPNNILTSPSEEIKDFNSSLKKLILEMEETLVAQVDPQGVGLAAPQIGKNIALFIIKPTPQADTEVFINPKILEIVNSPSKKTEGKAKKNTQLEGCLSIPRIWSPVSRPKKVLLEYQDLNGNKKQQWFQGFKAIIIQHEVDHLKGTLFTQRSLEQGISLYEEKNGELEKLEY